MKNQLSELCVIYGTEKIATTIGVVPSLIKFIVLGYAEADPKIERSIEGLYKLHKRRLSKSL